MDKTLNSQLFSSKNSFLLFCLFLAFLSGCKKKYDPNPDVAVKYVDSNIPFGKGGLDTLYVKFDGKYDGKGKVVFSTCYYDPTYYSGYYNADSYISIVESGKDYVIIDKKIFDTRVGVIATLVNEARVNSSDTIFIKSGSYGGGGGGGGGGSGKLVNKIVFTKMVGSKRDVFYMKPDGSNVYNFTNTPTVDELCPSVSPQGHLAYFSYGPGLDTLYLVNPNGTVKFKKLIGSLSALNFSSDGSYICFLSNQDPYVIDLNGSYNYSFSFPTSYSHSFVYSAQCCYYSSQHKTAVTYLDSYYLDYNLDYNNSGSNYFQTYNSYYRYYYANLSSDASVILYTEDHTSYASLMKRTPGYTSVLLKSNSGEIIKRPDFNPSDNKIVYQVQNYYTGMSDIYIMNSLVREL